MFTPDQDIAEHLAVTIPDAVLDTDLFSGPMRETPKRAIFCLSTGGAPPEARMGSLKADRFFRVQVTIRETPNNFKSGLTRARLVRDSLHYAPLSQYVEVAVAESEPNYLGEADDGQHLWTVNVDLRGTE